MYQTIAIFQKSSGFLEWKSVSSNSEGYIVLLLENSTRHQKALTRNSRCFQWVKITLFKLIKNNNCFNITYKIGWYPSTVKCLIRVVSAMVAEK